MVPVPNFGCDTFTPSLNADTSLPAVFAAPNLFGEPTPPYVNVPPPALLLLFAEAYIPPEAPSPETGLYVLLIGAESRVSAAYPEVTPRLPPP